MKTIRSIIRLAILAILATSVIFLIFGSPDESSSYWGTLFILSKIAGFAAAWVLARLTSHWRSDSWIRRLFYTYDDI